MTLDEEIRLAKQEKEIKKVESYLLEGYNENLDESEMLNFRYSENGSELLEFNYSDAISEIAKNGVSTLEEANGIAYIIDNKIPANEILESKTNLYNALTDVRKLYESTADYKTLAKIYCGLYEASAFQLRKTKSVIGKMVRDYLSKYAVRLTYRIKKHLAVVEKLFNDDPNKIRYVMVAMPLTSFGYYEYPIGTRIIIFMPDKIMVYGKGILEGKKAAIYYIKNINDVVINEGMIYSKLSLEIKQNDHGYSTISFGRISKKATPELLRVLQSYSLKINKGEPFDDRAYNDEYKFLTEASTAKKRAASDYMTADEGSPKDLERMENYIRGKEIARHFAMHPEALKKFRKNKQWNPELKPSVPKSATNNGDHDEFIEKKIIEIKKTADAMKRVDEEKAEKKNKK